MAVKITPTDRAANALIVRHGYTVAIKFKGKWLCAGQDLAQVTIRRIQKLGWIKPDPNHPKTKMIPTDKGRKAAEGETIPKWMQPLGESRWEVDFIHDFHNRGVDPLDYRPPMYEDDKGEPLALDEVFKDA